MARRATAAGGRDPEPSIRRAYFECRFGQLHVHNAMPAGGGFDEATPLLCMHRNGVTGRMFAGLMRTMGRDRSVYAPDLPGSGGSSMRSSASSGAADQRIREKLPLLTQPTLLLQARDGFDLEQPAFAAELRTFLSA